MGRTGALTALFLVLAAVGCRGVLGLSSSNDADGDAGAEGGAESSSGPSSADGSTSTPDGASPIKASGDDAGSGDLGTDGGGLDALSVTVDTLQMGRSKLGAHTAAGFQGWGGGIAHQGSSIYWVEGGATPGVYMANDTPCATNCVTPLATITRPSAFYATTSAMWIADVTQVKRMGYGAGTPKILATNKNELVALVSDDQSVFWTDEDGAINWTTSTGSTSTPVYSNGTPVSMGLGGTTVYWTGVDISGLQTAIQQMQTDGGAPQEVERSSEGFDTMHGNGTYLYYARDQQPVTVHRRTISTGHEDVVASDASRVSDIAVDDLYAYWAEAGDSPDYLDGRIRRVSHDGTKVQTLATSLPHPVAIAVSGNYVYIACAGTSAANFADGSIVRLTLH